jgi:hypothetical protein
MQEKNKKSYERTNSTRQTIRFEDELLEEIRGQIANKQESFASWVKEACRQRLERDK